MSLDKPNQCRSDESLNGAQHIDDPTRKDAHNEIFARWQSDEEPGWLTFDEITALSYHREDGRLMVPSMDTPFLPDGSVNYVLLPEPTNEPIPCMVEMLGDPTPDDAFVPASKLFQEYFTQYTAFKRFLEGHPEIRTRKPNPRRLLIHAGDWNRYWHEREQMDFKKLDNVSEKELAKLLEGIERLKDQFRSKKAKR